MPLPGAQISKAGEEFIRPGAAGHNITRAPHSPAELQQKDLLFAVAGLQLTKINISKGPGNVPC